MVTARFLGALLGVVVLTSAAFAQTESWAEPGGWLTTEEILAAANSPPPVQGPAERVGCFLASLKIRQGDALLDQRLCVRRIQLDSLVKLLQRLGETPLGPQ